MPDRQAGGSRHVPCALTVAKEAAQNAETPGAVTRASSGGAAVGKSAGYCRLRSARIASLALSNGPSVRPSSKSAKLRARRRSTRDFGVRTIRPLSTSASRRSPSAIPIRARSPLGIVTCPFFCTLTIDMSNPCCAKVGNSGFLIVGYQTYLPTCQEAARVLRFNWPQAA